MFLKSIEMLGFKSFADKTRIEFTDGISALLGPNGCGKSNVVDAIKWVLGEQATKSLRADKMEDVIFNGTESRKALNVAEVTLTLQNDNEVLALDLPEVTIKRRLFRNGESEYLVNNAPVRLKELRELFYDTGIGKSAYSIMEQGKIDQVLSNKPEERRNIFEEAAAITRFKVKGQEAERKLQRTDENIRQVENILTEVKRSYDSLQKQAEKTLSYRRLKDEAFRVDLDTQLLKLRDALEQKEKRSKELEGAVGERDAIKQSIDSINELVESNLDQVNSMESVLIENQKKLYGMDLEKNNASAQIQLLKERGAEIAESLKTRQDQAATLTERQKQAHEETSDKEKEMAQLSKRIEENRKNTGEFQANIQRTEDRMAQNTAESDAAAQRIRDWEEGIEALQADLQGITDDIVAQLDLGLKDSGYSVSKRQEIAEDFGTKLEALRILFRGKGEILKDAGPAESVETLQQAIGSLRQLLSEGDQRLQELAELFDRLQASIPDFLDKFLAPEGIMTRKRAIDEELASFRDRINQSRKKIQELTSENRELGAKVDTYKKTLEELKLATVSLEAGRSALQGEIGRLKSMAEEFGRQIGELQQQIAEDTGRIGGIEAKVREVEAKRKALEVEEKSLQKELSTLEKTISSKNTEMLKKERELKTNMTSLAKAQTKVERIQISLTEVQADIRNMYSNFRDKYSQELSMYESRIYEIREVLPALKKQADRIREEQRALGSVNLMAPEEFAEVKERYDFLNGQLEDLDKGKQDLHKITEEIRTESAELFTQTFDKIRRNFHSMFRRLFGGGRAEIRLTEPDDVLESGIEILAQPPGKKLESINLLSGGERSLTAVALLFATYMVKPSPFCLLDEIDAALDESNVGRFVNMLMEFGESSQFIVITHNKKTVAGARTLLGVTMEESGVSKVVAIRIGQEGEAIDPRAALHRS